MVKDDEPKVGSPVAGTVEDMAKTGRTNRCKSENSRVEDQLPNESHIVCITSSSGINTYMPIRPDQSPACKQGLINVTAMLQLLYRCDHLCTNSSIYGGVYCETCLQLKVVPFQHCWHVSIDLAELMPL
jgi:hypothetical protein